MTPTLRPLAWNDLEWLRDLRNASRERFFNTAEITPEQQLVWWTLQRPDEEHWIIEKTDSEVCASCVGKGMIGFFNCKDCGGKGKRITPTGHIGYFAFVRPNPALPIFPTAPLKGYVRYLNSLLLEQPYRGQGIMPPAIVSKMRDNISYCGYVKEDNPASLSTCLKTGMKLMGAYEAEEYGRLHVLWKG